MHPTSQVALFIRSGGPFAVLNLSYFHFSVFFELLYFALLVKVKRFNLSRLYLAICLRVKHMAKSRTLLTFVGYAANLRRRTLLTFVG